MKNSGLTLPELLITIAVLGILASLSCLTGAETLARQRLENATRTLSQSIEQARSHAMRNQTPCGMGLMGTTWQAQEGGSLPACSPDATPLQEQGFGDGGLHVTHNMPHELRFSSNGLVLDGGTVVLTMRGTSLRRCLVMALPLGVVRLGKYIGDTTSAPDSTACQPDPSL